MRIRRNKGKPLFDRFQMWFDRQVNQLILLRCIMRWNARFEHDPNLPPATLPRSYSDRAIIELFMIIEIGQWLWAGRRCLRIVTSLDLTWSVDRKTVNGKTGSVRVDAMQILRDDALLGRAGDEKPFVDDNGAFDLSIRTVSPNFLFYFTLTLWIFKVSRPFNH